MQKKLLVAAVAAAVAAPGVALAQSSVTISGFLKVSVQNLKISSPSAARTGNTSETRFVDDGPSRISFSMREDLGGGLAAVGQIELRHSVDGNTSFDSSGTGSSAGNMFVGLQSSSWGLLRLGSVDRHYTLSADTAAGNAPTFTGSPHVGATLSGPGGVGLSTVGGGTRTRNQVGWDSPNWSGFTMSLGWSARQVSGQEGDLVNVPTTATGLNGAAAGTKPRKGNAYWLTGRYDASNWFIGASYMNDKTDAGASNNASSSFDAVTCTTAAVPVCTTTSTSSYAAMRDNKEWRFVGRFNFGGGFGVGLNIDRTKQNNPNTGAGISNRTAWAVPFDYTTGPHAFGILYSTARQDKVIGAGSKSTAWSLRYVYSLSKRTSVGAGYLRLRNDATAAYNISGDNTTTANGYSSANAALSGGGEDARVFGMNMRHAF